jgi:sugar lactone lactonase YvrE
MYFPAGVAIDNANNLYIADYSYSRIRKVDAKTGVISTVAGTGQPGYSGDGGAATAAQLYFPFGVTTDSGGNLYIADTFNNVIRKVDATNGVISTVAGNGYGAGGNGDGGYTGDGGPATSAELNRPFGVAVDSAGNLYIADANNLVIRMVAAASGIISTVAGDGSACTSVAGDGGPATSAGFCYPAGVTADGAGNLYVADDRTPRIRQVRASSLPPTAQTAAPSFSIPPGTYAGPQTVTVADSTPGAAIYVTLDGSTPKTAGIGYLGPITVSGGMTIKAIAVAPGLIASAPATASYTITSEPTAVITSVAGDGVSGFSSGGGSPGNAQLGSLAGVALDRSGNLFFADATNDVVWELTAKTGLLSIVASLGRPGIGNNSGLGASFPFNGPAGVAADGTGNLFIADSGNNVVWKVEAGTGLIKIYAGQQSSSLGTDLGDGGPATSARLVEPSGLAVDSAGNLYIADTGDGLVRFVSAGTGVITSVAGVGPAVGVGSNADGIPATSANLLSPGALALDGNGNLYIALPLSGRVRKVTLSTGLITTVAGNGDAYGSSGDGGPALKAEVFPQGIAVDSTGNLYLSDPAEIRKVSAATGIISNFAGNRYFGYSGDGGSATVAEVANPQGIAFDASGDLYIADQANYRVREVFSSAHAFVTPEITVTASAATITDQQAITVAATVAGGSGQATPTGTVTLASGSYSSQQPLANGGASFTIPAGALTAATNTLTANYSGDSNYAIATGTTTITVVPLVVTVPAPPAVTPGSAATATATVSAGSTFSGTLNLTCALTASPANAQSLPTCSLNPASVVVAAGGKATTVVTVNTTAASSGNALNQWGGGGILALALLFVAPSLRRRKTTLLLIACGIAIIGCGGGGTASSTPPSTTTPATTPGTYTFLVTATDASNAKVTASANLTVTVE